MSMPPTSNPYFLAIDIRFDFAAVAPIYHVPVNGTVVYVGHVIEDDFDDAGTVDLDVNGADPFSGVSYDETSGLAPLSAGTDESQHVKRGDVINCVGAGDATAGVVHFTLLIKQDV